MFAAAHYHEERIHGNLCVAIKKIVTRTRGAR
jgi:hypothetical protein